jgi:hypothetical protein
MITNANEVQSIGGGYVGVSDLYGLSTDTKPVNVANGSSFTEIDTGKKFLFDYEGQQWYEKGA